MENTMQMKEKRVADAIALTEADRVPFAPKLGIGAYVQAGNTTWYEALMDFRTLKPGIINLLERYQPDLFWGPAGYPANVMEVLGTTAVRWPGPVGKLDRNAGFQLLDVTYMEQDEYDAFLLDPSRFFMNKVYPMRHKKLKGLSKLSFGDVVEFGHYVKMSAFADPEVREALLTLMAAGSEAAEWLQAQNEMAGVALQMETPLGVVAGQNAPYDMLADNLRGYVNLAMDVMEVPDKLLAALDVMTEFALENVRALKGLKYCFMPMHGGTDEMMSPKAFEKFYWPSLRRVMEEVIACGMIPYVFFEGKYNTRLDVIKEMPKGSCLYMFEKIDLVKAKKALKDSVGFCGTMPSASLIYGSEQEIIDETKRILDICAPGGGFIMDVSIVIDKCPKDKLHAMFDTAREYGRY